jgi:hypothetical protein
MDGLQGESFPLIRLESETHVPDVKAGEYFWRLRASVFRYMQQRDCVICNIGVALPAN